MNWRLIFLLYKKELLEFVRDRRTFLVMILVPALLYPGIIIVTSELAAKQIQKQSKKSYIVGVQKGFEESELVKKISTGETLSVAVGDKVDFEKFHVFIKPSESFKNSLDDLGTAEITVSYQSADNNSRFAYDKVSNIIDDYSEELIKRRLDEKGIPAGFIKPIKVVRDKVDKEVESRFIAGGILPGIMLVMLVVGCGLIAQEISAGEKERGTLETILCSPLSRLELVCGKYLTVATVGFASAIINLGCMSFTISNFASFMGGERTSIFSNFEIPLNIIPVILLCLVLVSFLVSGMTLIAASLARTVQEAGQYMIPITLILSLPVIFSSLPGVELEGMNRFVPFLNFCLLFKNLMIMKAGLFDVFAVLISTAVFALMVIYILIKIYNSESALFNHEGRSVLAFNRNSIKEKLSPESDDSILVYLIMLPVFFFVMNNLQKVGLGQSVIISQWGLFFLGSILFLKYFKINLKSSLSLNNPGAKNLLVCFLLTPICFLTVVYFQAFLKYLGLSGYEQETVDVMANLTNEYTFLGTICIISLTPAVCEEVFFRGLILSGLKKGFSTKGCILLQAIMFGVAHYSIFRFAGTAFMGALLTIVLIRTRSIYCTAIMHFTFNSFSCLLWAYGVGESDALEKIFINYAFAIVPVTLAGFILFKFLGNRTEVEAVVPA
ncbi:MAG: ABC transporter permease subunit [Lentisphaeraceae bacterium]|nr:ABC transporter permease subunit [Lentisphaeraceae bacterium]